MVVRRGGFKLEGFADLDAKLAALPNNIARGAALRGMKKAGNLMADEQRALAPVEDGTLVASIGVAGKSRNLAGLSEFGAVLRGGGSRGQVKAALRGARAGGSSGTRISVRIGPTAPHAHLVEFGTGPRYQKTTGKFVGVMPAQPFIRPAFDVKKGAALTAIKREITVEIGKAQGRLDRKAAKLSAASGGFGGGSLGSG